MKNTVNFSQKQAYKDIYDVCQKYSDNDWYRGDDIRDMMSTAKGHLMLIEWEEKYGLKISHEYNPVKTNYLRISDNLMISYYKNALEEHEKGSGRYISWSDDGEQPMNEWLFELSFSTGAYIFGDDYDGQRNLFEKFFNELKTYNPDFSDAHNSSLYWKLENAKEIFNKFNEILNKYRKINTSEFEQRKIKKLEDELKKLKEK
jgi:hypothetical protein